MKLFKHYIKIMFLNPLLISTVDAKWEFVVGFPWLFFKNGTDNDDLVSGRQSAIGHSIALVCGWQWLVWLWFGEDVLAIK